MQKRYSRWYILHVNVPIPVPKPVCGLWICGVQTGKCGVGLAIVFKWVRNAAGSVRIEVSASIRYLRLHLRRAFISHASRIPLVDTISMISCKSCTNKKLKLSCLKKQTSIEKHIWIHFLYQFAIYWPLAIITL